MILVVDDDHGVLAVVGRALRDAGHETTLVSSCAEGVALVQKLSFSAVVCDLHLGPDLGVQVLRATAEHQPNCLRILISGSEVPTGIRREAGAHLLLDKPISIKTLLDLLPSSN